MSQVEESSYTQAQFRNTFRNRQNFQNLVILGSDANGTHFSYEDALGERRFGVISDLTSTKIVRVGTVSFSLASGGASATVNVAISPALSGATADYLIFTSYNSYGDPSQINVSHTGRLTSLSNLRILISRIPTTAHVATDSTATTLTHESVDTTVIIPHTHNDTVGTAGHLQGDTHLHNVALPLHVFGLPFTDNIDWMIIRA